MTVTENAPTEAQLDEQVRGQLDEFGQKALDNVVAYTRDFNAAVARLNAIGGDPQAILESLRANPPQDDEQIVDLVGKIEVAEKRLFDAKQLLDNLLKPYVDRTRNEAEPQRAELEEAVADLRKKINTGRAFLKAVGPAAVERLFPKLDSVRGARSSVGTGTRRIRNRRWVVGEGENVVQYDGAGEAAKALGMDTNVFQGQFFQAAGSDDSSKWPSEVTFEAKGQKVVSIAA